VVASAAVSERADLVVVGDVYTVDAARSWAKAVAIRGDRIVAVGSEADVRERVGDTVEVLAGECVLPGFQDAHIHAAFAGRIRRHLNLDDLHSLADYTDRIAAHAAVHPDDAWIVGGGWYAPMFGDAGPHRRDLDAIVPERPVFLMNTDTHAAWVNTRALELAGVSAATPDPWDGYYVRDPDGTPTGCLQEGTAYTYWAQHVPPDSVEDWMASIRVAQTHLHALGLTGWQDAWVEPDLLRGYRSLDDAGELTARVITSLWWDRHRGLEQIGALVEQRSWGTGGNVDAGTIKIMLDGCPESGTASMLAPYEGRFGDEHDRGIQFVDEVLTDALVRLDALGFQVHQHALGDRAVRSALDAVEAARSANGWNDNRHHIAHLQLPDPADVPRLRPLGVVANIQPLWACPDPMIETLTRPRVGERANHLYPIGDVVRGGAVVAMGSDWPVSSPNVFEEMQVAVTRQVVGEGADSPVLDATQRITLAEAIAGFTRGSAYVDRDDDAGSLEEGKRADLVVLDRNPFAGSVHEIADTQVTATIAAGRVVHGA
jgi:predicted amidohydrolase YtcJ